MKTKVTKLGDTMVVTMDGRIDFETNEPFKQDMYKLAKQAITDSVPKKIIFNLENLEFVGSSGISSFVQTLKEFSARVPSKPKYCNVKSEFRRVMKAFDETDTFEFFDNEDRARRSFDQ